MSSSRSRSFLSFRARVFLVATTMVCELLTAGASQAQSGQVIVMTCKNEYPGRSDLTINLAARTVEQHHYAWAAGIVDSDFTWSITQISEDSIAYTESLPNGTGGYKRVLNRYTGVLTGTPFGTFVSQGIPPAVYCQTKQKQF